MLENNEIISIKQRIGLYYASVVKIEKRKMTLVSYQISKKRATYIQGQLKKGDRVYHEER